MYAYMSISALINLDIGNEGRLGTRIGGRELLVENDTSWSRAAFSFPTSVFDRYVEGVSML